MKNFLITFLFFIFATNNILFAEEITVYNKANAEKCAQGNCVNGQGTLTWTDGTKYEGEFKDDNINGQGTMTFANGAKYEGEFKDDNFHGQGTYTYADGDKEVGEWKDGKSVDGKTKLIETAANKRKRIEDEKRQRAKENNDQQRVTNQFTKIKTEAINAINKAQSCYNSLDGIGQSQIRSNLVNAKTTFNDAKQLERTLRSNNNDITGSAGVYESATMQANVVVNIMCN